MRQRALCGSNVLFRRREPIVLVVNSGHAHDRLAHVIMLFFEARELRISEVFRQVGDVVREELHALASICGNRVERLVGAAVIFSVYDVLGDDVVDERDSHEHELRLLHEGLRHLLGLE